MEYIPLNRPQVPLIMHSKGKIIWKIIKEIGKGIAWGIGEMIAEEGLDTVGLGERKGEKRRGEDKKRGNKCRIKKKPP